MAFNLCLLPEVLAFIGRRSCLSMHAVFVTAAILLAKLQSLFLSNVAIESQSELQADQAKMACSLWPVVLAVHYQFSCLLETVHYTCPDMQHFLSPYWCSFASSHLIYVLNVGFPFLKLRARVG